MTSGCASGGCGGVMAVQADRARMAAAVARVGSRLDAVTRLGGVRYGVGVAYDSGESLEWRLGEPSRLAVDRARVARRRPTGRGSGTGRRTAVEPGSDPSAYHEAEAVNDSVGGLFDKLPQELRDLVRVRIEPPEAEPECTGGCFDALAGSRTACPGPSLHSRDLDDFLALDPEDYRAFVRFGSTPRPPSVQEEALLITAWGLIIENFDILQWATCWALGETTDDCLSRVLAETDGGRVRIRLVRNGDNGGGHCENIDSRREVRDAEDLGAAATTYGSTINICDNVLWKGVLLAWCSEWAPSRASAALSVAALLAHELTHVCGFGQHDVRSPETECYRSYLVEGVFAYGLADRYTSVVGDTAVASYCGYSGSCRTSTLFGAAAHEDDPQWPLFLGRMCCSVDYSHDDYVADPGLEPDPSQCNRALEHPCA